MSTATLFPPSPTQRALWQAGVNACRAGIRTQGVLAQDQLALVGRLLDDGLGQVREATADSPLLQQVRSAGQITDGMVGLARILADMQTRGATQALEWWQEQVEGLLAGRTPTGTVIQTAAPAAATPDTRGAAPAPRKAAARKKTRAAPAATTARAGSARRKRSAT